MANFLLGAALSGVGAGAATFGSAMMQERQAAERERMMLEREQRQEEARQERFAASTRGGGGGGGGRGNVFDAASADDRFSFATQPIDDVDAARAGGAPVMKSFGATPEAPTQEIGAMPGYEAQVQRGRELLRSVREAIALGGNVANLADARSADQKRGQLDRFEAGSQPAGEAAMVGQGKDIYGGNSDVTRNAVGGQTTQTEVGKARAQDLREVRAAPTARAAPAFGGTKPITGVDLERAARAAEKDLAISLGVPTGQLQEAVQRLNRRGTMTEEQTRLLANYRSALTELRAISSGRTGAAAPRASGTTASGSTFTLKGN